MKEQITKDGIAYRLNKVKNKDCPGPSGFIEKECRECDYGKKHGLGSGCELWQNEKCFANYNYKAIKENGMKKSELKFKCLTGCRARNMAMLDEFRRIGIVVDDDLSRFRDEALAIEFCDNSFIWCQEISDGYLASTKPEMLFCDAIEQLKSIEPDAPEFDIKPFDRILLRDLNGEWSADFYNKIYSTTEFDCISCQAEQIIKYEGNEQYHGTTDTPAGWWECENGKPIWRTK